MMNIIEELKINAHGFEELETMGISKEMVLDVVDSIEAFKEAVETDNIHMANILLSNIKKEVYRIARLLDYSIELKNSLSRVIDSLYDFVKASIINKDDEEEEKAMFFLKRYCERLEKEFPDFVI
jgi:hypothetical protein